VPKTSKQGVAAKRPNATELMVTRALQIRLDGIAIRACVALMRRSKRHLYSITSSARTSNEGGTVRRRPLRS